MNVLSKLTKEYFGDILRKEDYNIESLFENNLENRNFFVSVLKKKGWGENQNNFLLFDENTTIDDVIILNENRAKDFLKKNEEFNIVSIETFLTTKDTYFESFNIPLSKKEIDDKFKKICKLYYDYPQVVTYYLLLYFNDYNELKYSDNLIPFSFDTYISDEYFETDSKFEEGDNIMIFNTTFGFLNEKKWYKSFTQSYNDCMKDFNAEMIKNGFKLSETEFGSYPAPTESWCYFYK